MTQFDWLSWGGWSQGRKGEEVLMSVILGEVPTPESQTLEQCNLFPGVRPQIHSHISTRVPFTWVSSAQRGGEHACLRLAERAPPPGPWDGLLLLLCETGQTLSLAATPGLQWTSFSCL